MNSAIKWDKVKPKDPKLFKKEHYAFKVRLRKYVSYLLKKNSLTSKQTQELSILDFGNDSQYKNWLNKPSMPTTWVWMFWERKYGFTSWLLSGDGKEPN